MSPARQRARSKLRALGLDLLITHSYETPWTHNQGAPVSISGPLTTNVLPTQEDVNLSSASTPETYARVRKRSIGLAYAAHGRGFTGGRLSGNRILWVEEGEAKKVFGDRSPILQEALGKARADIWTVAGRFLIQQDLEAVRDG